MGGYAYHVLNRANGRLRLFKKDADFGAFDEVLAEALERVPLRIQGYTVMGNHWHFVVWPRQRNDQQVTDFFRLPTRTRSAGMPIMALPAWGTSIKDASRAFPSRPTATR